MNKPLKRVFDLTLSFSFLGLTFPFLLAIALAILLDSPGPVLFKGRRVGVDGREFDILKFRTMVDQAPASSPAITGKKDPRITRVGRFLRKHKLDEIPQLLNVLRGEMSLVGPRPEDPKYVRTYTPEQREVLSVRPGIASPAAVRFRHEEAILADVPFEDLDGVYLNEILPEKLALDLEYVRRHSIALDIRILKQAVLSSLKS